MENKKITKKKRDLTKLFSATMPYSLEAIRMESMFPEIPEVFYEKNNKQYTTKIINVTFDKHYTKWDEKNNKNIVIAHRRKIRKLLYKNGFVMDGVHYIFYKRGAGKAKNGYAFFIDEKMKDKLIERSRLGIEFTEDEEVDLTSLLAYESLITSGIDFTINLDPKTEILLIDDIYGKEFETIASVTRENNKIITTKNEKIKLRNCLTDGQGFMDESEFEKYGKSNKGFMLLRSDMFKDCAFNTKLQKWFKENGIIELTDMFGNVYKADRIKLVITPNSLKFLKFAYKFTDSKTKKEYDKLTKEEKFLIDKKCYEHWKNNIDDIFGVVKCDKDGNFGNYNRTTYQLLNSIPNLTYQELEEITKQEREYVMLLKNDNAVFKHYLGCDAKNVLKLEKCIEEGDISLYENTDLMNALLLVNSDIQYTKKFKKMKSDLIANYIGHLREGKIRMKDTKYVTLVSNPYEMLLATIGKYNNESIMEGREIYCPYYDDGTEFCASRNPHINAGNVMYTTNKYHDEYKEWFNFTDNICAINFFDNDAPDRLQGCDTDSDTFLLNPNYILASKAKYCEENFPTPINRVEGSKKPRKYNMVELQKLDVILSDNYIGKIVNMSQIINSYLNDAIYRGESEEVVNTLYQASSRLSSMSQIEIDKSKKVFDNISMSKELAEMRKIMYIRYVIEKDKYGQDVKKMVVPIFFSMVSKENNYRVFEKFNTPMDYLFDILKFDGGKRLKGEKHKDIIDLLVKSKDLDGRYRSYIALNVFNIIEKCGKKINGLKLKSCTLNNKAKATVERKSKKEAVDELKRININDATILSVLKQAFGNKNDDKIGYKRFSILTLNLLFMSKKIQILNCFKNNNIDINEVLVKIKNEYDYDIFGDKYQKVNKCDLV
jgi:hypothetical protein